MRFIAKILVTVFLLSIPVAVAEAQTFKIYDKDWNPQGYVQKVPLQTGIISMTRIGS